MKCVSFNSLDIGSYFVTASFFISEPYVKTGPESARRLDKETNDEFIATTEVYYFNSEEEAIKFANERNEELLSAEEKKNPWWDRTMLNCKYKF